ncbi:MAG: hypothetical protein ACYC6L_07090 [Anaerolineae bacterium]
MKRIGLLVCLGIIALGLASACRLAAPNATVEPNQKPTAVKAASAAAQPSRFYNLPLVEKQSTPSPAASATHDLSTPKPTDTPLPTATPTPAWPETMAEPGRSKLGLHVQNNNSPNIMEFVRRVKPRAMKGVDDLGFLNEVKQISPQTVTIGRFSDVPQTMEGDPIQAAHALVDTYLARYREFPGVDYWEGLNEPGISGKMAWFAEFEAERVRYMASFGLKCAIGSFSTGVPEYADFAAFLPAIRTALEYNGILTLHEYDAPTLYRSVGMSLPGQAAVANRGALALRYRWWYEDFLKPRGLVIPLVISEVGIDGAVGNHPGPQGLGWQDFVDYWRAQGLDPDGKTEYLKQLAWYDGEIQQDSYVLGATIFTAGSVGQNWKSFEILDMLRDIAFYLASLK